MLKLKNVCKSYIVNKEKKNILDNITLDFDNKGLVLILGASGSGKSTLLNIIGGNLKCDSGEIWFDGVCINKLKQKELDNYRKSVVGTIFQDYNLIQYMDVYDNIVLGSDKKIDIDILKELDIYNKRYVRVNKLSGGEKQRVAIARAIMKDSKVLLCDEPTGALDSKNSILVMEILKKTAYDRLVIVVSHDKELVSKYADRIINISDGKCFYEAVECKEEEKLVLCNKKVNYKDILKLGIKNLWLKKVRTLISALAIALGLMGVFTVINLYNNFNKEINDLEKRVVSIFPIVVSNGEYKILDAKDDKSDSEIIVKDKSEQIHTNRISQKYIDYIKNIREVAYLNFNYDISMPVISDNDKLIDNKYLRTVPSIKYISDNYLFLAGKNIKNLQEILLKIDSNNNVPSELMDYFGIDNNISYDEIIGRKVKIITNNNYYMENNGYYVPGIDYNLMYEKSNIELTIVGVIKEKEIAIDESYLYFDNGLIEMITDINSDSEIVKKQIEKDYNVLGLNIGKNEMLSYLGYNVVPVGIEIYVNNLDNKDRVIKYLDDYNHNNEKLIYVDTMSDAVNVLKQLMMVIGVILIIFSVVSIIISLLMIGILTNVRVLECKKEIGILRSLGFSKKNIRSLFNTENVLLGVIAIVISIILINLMVHPLNMLVNKYLDEINVFDINYVIFILVGLFNIFIVREAGIIPAIRASRLDIVSCIYDR